MQRRRRRVLMGMVLAALGPGPAAAQDDARLYAGGLFGVATLSADARSVTEPESASASMYKPENGPAVNAYIGAHVGRFLTVQANYVWNRNDVALFGSFVSPAGGGFYEQPRQSSQHAAVGDLLLYFRRLGDPVRPYLSAGVGVMRFASGPGMARAERGLPAPRARIASTRPVLRVAVGIDLKRGRAWSFRYSFSETISGNPVSASLMPEGQRGMANFQNLFGMTRHF